MQLSNYDLKRYFKQIILKNIGVSGQKKIASSKILVIGVGGLGHMGVKIGNKMGRIITAFSGTKTPKELIEMGASRVVNSRDLKAV